MIEAVLPYAGGLGIIISAVLVWLSTSKKTGVDESGIVFAQWKTLMESHKEDMRILKAEFNDYKSAAEKQSEARNREIDTLRARLSSVEDKFADFRRESDDRIRALDEENQGLRKEIAKVGKAAHAEILLVAAQSEATVSYIEDIEPEARKAHEEIKEQLSKLDMQKSDKK